MVFKQLDRGHLLYIFKHSGKFGVVLHMHAWAVSSYHFLVSCITDAFLQQ